MKILWKEICEHGIDLSVHRSDCSEGRINSISEIKENDIVKRQTKKSAKRER